MAKEIKLEVCVDSIDSALAASLGGASRIELCSALSEGGLTPTSGVLKVLKDAIEIPIYCMLRPRRGNDFVYTQLEFEAMLNDMECLRQHGADGFVFGALTKHRDLDMEKCQQIVRQAVDLPVTFHRAFDLTDPNVMHNTVVRLKEMGFRRILSSGFKQTVAEGIDSLAELVAKHHRDIIVMPGAGINVANLDEILTVTKCTEFHSSCKAAAGNSSVVSTTNSNMEYEEVTMDKPTSESYLSTEIDVVRKMIAIARAFASH